jgi:tetratricopeptide (TPR) repeat protein
LAGNQILVDIAATGHALLSTGAAVDLAQPLGAEELEELRWYLEDYLQVPYGVYEDRGSRIAGLIAAWGQRMYGSLFGSGEAGPDEIVVRSATPAWLGLPWELMRDPRGSAPLVLDGVKLSRELPGDGGSRDVRVAAERLRVLMVISRPAGTRDVGYRMIARPLLESMQNADLTVLRPATLAALEEQLRAAKAAGSPFQIVHFDGHGSLAGDKATLAFERPGGGTDHVTADRIATVLTGEAVPVVVLNACQSGAVGKDLEAAMATGLLSGGVPAVVAMAYRVYAAAAAEFMTAFYERLFAGDTVGEAVRAGRSRMARNPRRPSPKGDLPLDDWVIPVHYRRGEVRFPQLRTAPRPRVEDAPEEPLAPEGDFVGRDDVFFTLEELTRTDRVVVLHGPAGTGKTEVAKAFGRWWRDTGGADHVLWHSFEPGIASFGLDGVLLEAGMRLDGPDFARHDPAARRTRVMDLLRQHRVLMIWDNFESVASMPDPAAPPLDETARGDLRDFLRELSATGRSTVLVTSRTPEEWLGDVRRVAVGGLRPPESAEYADRLLAPFPAAQARRTDRAFAELLEWLDGHPLSMRLTLPHLQDTEPAVLLAQLRGADPALPAAEGEGRTTSLAASVAYSIVHLDPADQRRLVALSLFHGVTDPAVLGVFSALEETPERFRDVSGDEWTALLDRAVRLGLLRRRPEGGYGIYPALPAYLAAQWRAEETSDYQAQRDAGTRSLLTAYGGIAQELGSEENTALALQFTDQNRRVFGYLLDYAIEHHLWPQAQLVFIPLVEYLKRRGLNREAESWAVRARLAAEGPGGTPPAVERPEGSLWAVAMLAEGNRLTRARDLDAAEATYTEMLNVARNAAQIPELRPILAILYSKLGFVAGERRQLDEAERWYRQAQGIYEERGDRHGIAQMIRHLGDVAHARGRWDEAEEHYHRALALRRELGELESTALLYDRLAGLADDRGRLDEAERWYDEARSIAEERGDWDGLARSVHGLAMVTRKRGRLDDAERWYREALTLAEKAHDRPGMAACYGNLGVVALQRGQDESEDWFRRALAINQELGNRSGMAANYKTLGIIAIARKQAAEAERLLRQSLALAEETEDRNAASQAYHLLGGLAYQNQRWDESEEWLRKALAIEEDMDDQAGASMAWSQLALVSEGRGHVDEALERAIKCKAMSQRFPHVQGRENAALLARLARPLGIRALEQRWKQVTGEPLPEAVRESLEQEDG